MRFVRFCKACIHWVWFTRWMRRSFNRQLCVKLKHDYMTRQIDAILERENAKVQALFSANPYPLKIDHSDIRNPNG